MFTPYKVGDLVRLVDGLEDCKEYDERTFFNSARFSDIRRITNVHDYSAIGRANYAVEGMKIFDDIDRLYSHAMLRRVVIARKVPASAVNPAKVFTR